MTNFINLIFIDYNYIFIEEEIVYSLVKIKLRYKVRMWLSAKFAYKSTLKVSKKNIFVILIAKSVKIRIGLENFGEYPLVVAHN